jgi:hypothetical protein
MIMSESAPLNEDMVKPDCNASWLFLHKLPDRSSFYNAWGSATDDRFSWSSFQDCDTDAPNVLIHHYGIALFLEGP